MKKLILILMVMAFGFGGFSQTLMHTDTLTRGSDTLFMKWYHEQFTDADGNNGDFKLISRVGLVKDYVLADTTYESVMTHYHRTLSETDSLKNPYGENYFQAPFVREYIYTTDEGMKRTLSLYWILNTPERVME